MASKLQQEAIAAVKAWCKENDIVVIGSLRHVNARAYVVGQAAAHCLVVAECWADKEPQARQMEKLLGRRENALKQCHHFDRTLQAGDWCMTAYVVTHGWSGPVAVPIPEID